MDHGSSRKMPPTDLLDDIRKFCVAGSQSGEDALRGLFRFERLTLDQKWRTLLDVELECSGRDARGESALRRLNSFIQK